MSAQTTTTPTLTDMVRKIAEYDGWKQSSKFKDMLILHERGISQTLNRVMQWYRDDLNYLHPVAVRVYEELKCLFEQLNMEYQQKGGLIASKYEIWSRSMYWLNHFPKKLLKPFPDPSNSLLTAVYNGIMLIERQSAQVK